MKIRNYFSCPLSINRNNRFFKPLTKKNEIFEYWTSGGLEKLFKIFFKAGFSKHGHFIFSHQISIERNICSRWPFHCTLEQQMLEHKEHKDYVNFGSVISGF